MTVNLTDDEVFTITMALADMVTDIDNEDSIDDGDKKLRSNAKSLLKSFLPASRKVKFF